MSSGLARLACVNHSIGLIDRNADLSRAGYERDMHRMVPGCAGYVGRCDRFGA
jgi:hypothetical protein